MRSSDSVFPSSVLLPLLLGGLSIAVHGDSGETSFHRCDGSARLGAGKDLRDHSSWGNRHQNLCALSVLPFCFLQSQSSCFPENRSASVTLGSSFLPLRWENQLQSCGDVLDGEGLYTCQSLGASLTKSHPNLTFSACSLQNRGPRTFPLGPTPASLPPCILLGLNFSAFLRQNIGIGYTFRLESFLSEEEETLGVFRLAS